MDDDKVVADKEDRAINEDDHKQAGYSEDSNSEEGNDETDVDGDADGQKSDEASEEDSTDEADE